MYCFLVVSVDINQELIDKEFPLNYRVKDGIWAVAAERFTVSNTVSDRLGFDPGKFNGIVIRVQDYYGCYNPALWTTLSTWLAADG